MITFNADEPYDKGTYTISPAEIAALYQDNDTEKPGYFIVLRTRHGTRGGRVQVSRETFDTVRSVVDLTAFNASRAQGSR